MSYLPDVPSCLEWAPSGLDAWELRSARGVVARLERGEGAWVALVGAERFVVQRVGFHRPRVVLRPTGGLAEVAYVTSDWRGVGSLCFSSGPTWEVDATRVGALVVRDDATREVATVTRSGDYATPAARLRIEPDVLYGRHGPIVLALSGFLFLDNLGDLRQPTAIGVIRGSVRSRFA